MEIDRRRVRRRIADLRREIKLIETHRKVQRHRREKLGIPTVALVGYTNAGKSTLFNRLTGAGVSFQDRLFDTLDPVSRRIRLSDRDEIILLDTVGFIRDLPIQLVAAFKATLEETIRSTMLIHVMDCTSRELMEQYRAVRAVLAELEIPDKEVITVLNKSDLIESEAVLNRLSKEWSALPVSALTGTGVADLLNEIKNRLGKGTRVVHLLIPFAEAGRLDLLHRKARVLEEEFTAEGIKLAAEMEESLIRHYQGFQQEGTEC